MIVNRITSMMVNLREQGSRAARKVDHLSNGWLQILVTAVREVLKPQANLTAAAIAYFSLFSLFPLILLSITITSLNLDMLMNQELVIKRLEFIAPALGMLLGRNIDQIIRVRGPVTGGALVGLVWSASTIFYILTVALYEIWGVKRRRPVWKGRGVAILFVLSIVGSILFMASLSGSVLTALPDMLPGPASIQGAFSLVIALLLDIIMFMVLYMMLPHGGATWREVLPGAIGAGFLWELAKKAFLLFVSTYLSVSNLVYGSVAAIIAFLAWAYLSGLIFLFGAYLTVSIDHQKRLMRASWKTEVS